MATGLHLKAAGRAEEFTAAIRDFLRKRDGNAALTEACRRLRSEAKKTREHRAADGLRADAEFSGVIAALAALCHDYKPPAGDPSDIFAEAFERTLREAGGE